MNRASDPGPPSQASTERLPSTEAEEKQIFARLCPLNDNAKLAMDAVAKLARQLEAAQPWTQHLKVGGTVPFPLPTDSDTESASSFEDPRSILEAEYEFSLDDLPNNIGIGWTLGAHDGRVDGCNGRRADMVITTKERKKDDRVATFHARITINFENGFPSICVGEKRRVEANGRTVENGQLLLEAATADLTFGNLTFRMEFLDVDPKRHRDQLAVIRKHHGHRDVQAEVHDSLSSTPTPVLPPDYALQQIIGQGTYGRVYIAVRRDDDKCVLAAKRISRTRRNIDAIKNEINILRAVKGHENVIEMVDCWFSSGGTEAGLNRTSMDEAFLFVRPLALGTLDLIIGDGSAWSVSDQIFRQVGEGVLHLHSLGVIQRDIKPGNIYIESVRPLHLRLGDFGHATLEHGSKDHYKGTIYFLGPEIIEQKRLDAQGELRKAQPWTFASDYWAVGMVMYQLFKQSTAPPTGSGGITRPRYLEIRHELEDDTLWGIPRRSCKLALGLLQWNPYDRRSLTEMRDSEDWPSVANIFMTISGRTQ